MTEAYRATAARSLAADPHRLAAFVADVLDITHPDARELLTDLCVAIITHDMTSPGTIARRYLGTGIDALRREFHRAGLPPPLDCIALVRLSLYWLHIQGHEGVTVFEAAFLAGLDGADASQNLYRLTGFRPTAARHVPLAAMLERWGRRIVPVAQPARGQLALFAG